jgi:hypothetical protein
MQAQTLRRFALAPLAALVLGIAFMFGTLSASADQRDFTLVNATGRVITSAYVSPSTSGWWGRDVLGRDVLPAWQATGIYFSGAGQCLYDIRVEGPGGLEGELYSVNLCATSTVTFH